MRPSKPYHPALVLLAGCIGVALHAVAGIADEGHAVWRPVGYFGVFAAFMWLLAALVALDGVSARGMARVLSGGVLFVSLIGLALLLFP